MKHLIRHLRSLFVALIVLALSAGLAFGAAPQASWGLANAASHAGKTVPVAGGQDDTLGEDDETTEEEDAEDTEDTEDTEEGVESEEAGENCTDPTLLPEEDLANVKHGSIVCWAAHQTEWPEWFSGHGPWVKCWAHHGKADWVSCTEDPAAEDPTGEEPSIEEGSIEGAAAARGNGKGQGKGKGKKARD